jgi:hypothetical protein
MYTMLARSEFCARSPKFVRRRSILDLARFCSATHGLAPTLALSVRNRFLWCTYMFVGSFDTAEPLPVLLSCPLRIKVFLMTRHIGLYAHQIRADPSTIGPA